ncbi:LHFPL tetraspan subfamily member 2 protein [Anopheles bellator]|uniref:LHFPL tetraspan subfamily member 2 protein n=1 Tax=Anopheles bellator TaxID=139047 RepID=UPI0026488068|nr:LHFPL tetraspan subfamily member 2 protein [Anopheles bellator]
MCGKLLITARGVTWFLTTVLACMTLLAAIVLPTWLIGPELIPIENGDGNFTIYRQPSVGIYNRCKRMGGGEYNCGNFDLYGLATDPSIFPVPWKFTMTLMCVGTILLAMTLVCTLTTCFRVHTFCGRSVYKLIGIFQGVAAMMVLCGFIIYPLGWSEPRVKSLCGLDAEAYYPSDCNLGEALYLGATGVMLAFFSAIGSARAESAYYSVKAQQRMEEGQVLVCVP